MSLLIAGVTASLPARAGNDDEIFVGNQAAMAGGAVSATVSDSSATWYNPAGLGAVGLDQIDVSGTCYALRSYSTPGFIVSRTGERHSASVAEFVSVPSQVAFVRRLRPGMSLGLGYFVPQASHLLLRESLQLQQSELRSAWQVSLNELRSHHAAAAGLGLQLSSRVRVGFSLIGLYEAETESVSVVGAQGLAAAPELAQQAFIGTALLGTSTRVAMEVGTGFQIELASDWRLALTARSARVLLYQLQRVTGATVAALGGGVEAQIADPRVDRASFDVIRAGRFNVALAHLRARGGWLSLEADVQPGVYDATAGIERRAVVNARLGLVHPLTETLAIGVGVFSDRSPDPVSRDPISARGDFYGGSLGLEYNDRHRLEAQAARTGSEPDTLSLSTTLALRYAWSRGRLNGLLVDPANVGDLAAAPGRLSVHELGLYVGGGLSF